MNSKSIFGWLTLLGFILQVFGQRHEVKVVQTAKYTNDRLTPQPSIFFSSSNSPADIEASIDSSIQYQQILGFGGAFTEASAYVFSLMKPDIQNKILKAYFTPEGLNYTLCRVHIESCDFCLQSYTFAEVADDFNLAYFNISHDQKWLIPYIQSALKTSPHPLKIYASPWSPPAWAKGNGEMDGSSIPGLKSDLRYHKMWALFFSKFISSYNEEGIPIWGVTVQNEPEFAAPWEACVYTPEQERDFVKNYLGPQLKKDHPAVKIMIYDHNKDHIANWAQTIYSDPDAAKYVAGTAFHWYTGSQFENLNTTHYLFPDKFMLATEACNCPGVSLNDWGRGESYAYDILGDLNNFAVGWVDWNQVLDMQGGPNHLKGYCDANIVCDPDNQVMYFQTTYYFTGQISKFVLAGSHRIGLTTSVNDPNFSIASFLTPENRIVVVALNQNDSPKTLRLKNSGQNAIYQLPTRSIVTFSFQAF